VGIDADFNRIIASAFKAEAIMRLNILIGNIKKEVISRETTSFANFKK